MWLLWSSDPYGHSWKKRSSSGITSLDDLIPETDTYKAVCCVPFHIWHINKWHMSCSWLWSKSLNFLIFSVSILVYHACPRSLGSRTDVVVVVVMVKPTNVRRSSSVTRKGIGSTGPDPRWILNATISQVVIKTSVVWFRSNLNLNYKWSFKLQILIFQLS